MRLLKKFTDCLSNHNKYGFLYIIHNKNIKEPFVAGYRIDNYPEMNNAYLKHFNKKGRNP